MADAVTNPARSVTSAKVFVSYSRDDKDFARQLFMVLEDKGFGPMMDVRAIDPGEPWQDRLINLIDQCDTVVFVLSDAYLASEACGWEVDEAQKRHKRLVPILPAKLSGGVVPKALSSLQYIYFYADPDIPDSGFYDGIRKLELALRQDLDWLRLRRRYEERAADWQTKSDDDLLLQGQLLDEANRWSARPPEGQSVPEGVAGFLDASRALAAKRLARERRFRFISMAALVLGVVLLTAAVVAAYIAIKTQNDLGVAKNDLSTTRADSQIQAQASNSWARGREQRTLYERFRAPGVFAPAQSDEVYEYASRAATNLGQAYDQLNEELSADGKQRQADFFNNVRRDLAKVRFYQGDGTALILMNEIIASTPAPKDQDTRKQLADDYISRAIYSCLNPTQRPLIRGKLAEAPADVRALFSPDQVSKEDTTVAVCPEVKEALCAVTDCGVQMAGEIDIIPGPPSSPDAPSPPPNHGTPGPTPTPPPTPAPTPSVAQMQAYAINEIYLHIGASTDRNAAKLVKAELEAGGKYKVLGIQLVDPPRNGGSNRSVRYYYTPQAAQAQTIAGDCIAAAKVALAKLTPGSSDAAALQAWTAPYPTPVSLAGRYDGLPPNRIEVWF